MWRVLITVFLAGACHAGIFDYTEFDDPFAGVIRVKNSLVRQGYGTCRTPTEGVTQWEGLCMTKPECTFTGGTTHGRGNCFLGVCCIYERRSCGKRSNKRISYFDRPSDDDGNCEFTVDAENDNVCQMRIDFEDMNLAPPTQRAGSGAFMCQNDVFSVVQPQIESVPKICGFNSGQHMYVPVNASAGEKQLRMRIQTAVRGGTGGGSLPVPTWRIKVTQIECPTYKTKNFLRLRDDSHLRAPNGCLQYFTARSGTISNFGFDPTVTASPSTNRYIGGHDYAICFRKSVDVCGVSLAPQQFSLSGTSPCDPANDFLFVPEARSASTGFPADQNNKFCGTMITSAMQVQTTPPGPLYIHWKTDTDAGDATEIGFQIDYTIPAVCDI